MKKIAILSLLLGFVMLGTMGSDTPAHTAFSPVTVAEALNNPRYVGQGIILTGTVTADVGIGSLGWFRLKDATGTISVLNLSTVPEDHHSIELWATLHQILALGHTRVVVLVAKKWTDLPAQGIPHAGAETPFHNDSRYDAPDY